MNKASHASMKEENSKDVRFTLGLILGSRRTSLNIIILNDYGHVNGGAGSVAINSARGLAQAGHKVTLFTSVGPVEQVLESIPNLRVICLGQSDIASDRSRLRAIVNGTWNVLAARSFSGLLKDLEPRSTVVHVHSWTKALSSSVLHEAFKRKFPVVVTMHDFFSVCPNGGFFVYPEQTLCHRIPMSADCLSCRCDRRNHFQKAWRVGRTYIQNQCIHLLERATCFVAVSKFSLDIISPYLPFQSTGTIVRNPISIPSLGIADVEANRSFVFVGRLNKEKAPMLFAEAARAAGVDAVFVGDGELREELSQKFPEYRITGWLTPGEMCNEIRSARGLVLPSMCYETLGLVVVEAAANGVPSIVSDQTGARDLVVDGVSGLHFEWGSSQSLTGALQRMSEGSSATLMGQAAYEWYWSNPWTLDSHVRDLEALYKETLAGLDGGTRE